MFDASHIPADIPQDELRFSTVTTCANTKTGSFPPRNITIYQIPYGIILSRHPDSNGSAAGVEGLAAEGSSKITSGSNAKLDHDRICLPPSMSCSFFFISPCTPVGPRSLAFQASSGLSCARALAGSFDRGTIGIDRLPIPRRISSCSRKRKN